MRPLGYETEVEEYLKTVEVLPSHQMERPHLHENRQELFCDIEDAMCLMEATQFFYWEDSEGRDAIARCTDHIPNHRIYQKQAVPITRDEYIVTKVLHT